MPPKMSRALRISEDPGWIAEDSDAWGDIREDDRAGGQLGAGTDLATRNDARSRAHEDAFADLDETGDIAMSVRRRPSADGRVMADSRAEIQDHEIT